MSGEGAEKKGGYTHTDFEYFMYRLVRNQTLFYHNFEPTLKLSLDKIE